MDTTFQTEFRGRAMTLKRLTDGQIGILVSLKDSDDKTAAGHVRRVMMIIESRMGEDDWIWLQDQIAMGDVGLQDLIGMLAGAADDEKPVAQRPNVGTLDIAARLPQTDADEIAMAEAALAALRAKAAAK